MSDEPKPMLGPDGFDIRAWIDQLPKRGWTADMLHQMPDPFRFEIIDGVILGIWPDEEELFADWDPGKNA